MLVNYGKCLVHMGVRGGVGEDQEMEKELGSPGRNKKRKVTPSNLAKEDQRVYYLESTWLWDWNCFL